ncbi:MAG: hypothetical protein PF693_12650 [Spirochaetia bacterium]|jgi:5-methylcytosine-specific restriction enzyme subunit McrC|nr:hypothetical protein [Spirochaetia bacterium]
MINLFEYQNKVEYEGSIDDLENFLDDLWQKRENNSYYNDPETEKIEVQRFLQFLHKSNEIKSNKYVGVIHFEGQKINLLPKIFFEEGKGYSDSDINAMHNHILWWLSYCRKIKFPSYQTSPGSVKGDFFEILIYLFSKYTRELLSNSIYQQYEEVENELFFIKGRLNTNKYINQNVTKGRWHKLNCVYDAFILDEVSDVRATAEMCSSILFNPIFKDFETVRDYCFLFLNNSISLEYKNELKLFAFFLPMEYVFEDFIFGFIDKETEEIRAKAQVSAKYLDQSENFSLRPDLFLELDKKKIIADTKYKIIYSDNSDPKEGISQVDLYQMLAYAVRFKIDEIILFYPDTLKDYQDKRTEITIKDELADGVDINIHSYQLPIINRSLFENPIQKEALLSELFESTRIGLIERIINIFNLQQGI